MCLRGSILFDRFPYVKSVRVASSPSNWTDLTYNPHSASSHGSSNHSIRMPLTKQTVGKWKQETVLWNSSLMNERHYEIMLMYIKNLNWLRKSFFTDNLRQIHNFIFFNRVVVCSQVNDYRCRTTTGSCYIIRCW